MRALSVQFHKEAEALVGWLTARDSLAAAAKISSVDHLFDHVWATSLQALTDKLFAEDRGEEAAMFTSTHAQLLHPAYRLKAQDRRGSRTGRTSSLAPSRNLRTFRWRSAPTSSILARGSTRSGIHPERHLEVVDYKLSQGHEQKADLVQLAIYAHLLPIWRPGCEFCGTLEYYLPEFSEVACLAHRPL